jgi:hypothetical protein
MQQNISSLIRLRYTRSGEYRLRYFSFSDSQRALERLLRRYCIYSFCMS